MIAEKTNENSLKRIVSIDRFRGIAVFCMIFFQFVANFEVFGWFAKIAQHNLSKGGIYIFQNTSLADIIAPMFMFAIALSYKASFDKRIKVYGKKQTVIHFVIRNLALVGVGAIFKTVNILLSVVDGAPILFFDYFMIAGFAVFALAMLLQLVFLIKPLKKYKKILSKVVSYTLVFMALLTIVVTTYDAIMFMSVPSFDTYGYWMVLQALGFAGLMALPFMFLKVPTRFAVATGVFVAYALLARLTNISSLLAEQTQGGIFGTFGWLYLIVIGTIFAEIFVKDKKKAYLYLLGFVAVAVGAYFLFRVGDFKRGVRPEPIYVLLSLAISAGIFVLVDLFNFYKGKFDPLAWWGKYPFLLYILEFCVIGVYTQFAPDALVKNASLPVAIITTTIMIGLFTTIVYFLNKKNKKITV